MNGERMFFSTIVRYSCLISLLAAICCTSCKIASSSEETDAIQPDRTTIEATVDIQETTGMNASASSSESTHKFVKLDLNPADPNMYLLYSDEYDDVFVYVHEPLTSWDGWYNGENFYVYITDSELNILYEKVLRYNMHKNGFTEYYVIDGTIYEIYTEGTDEHISYEWRCCLEWNFDAALGKQCMINVSCSPQQDFSGILRKLLILKEGKNRGECVLRLGVAHYELENISQEDDWITVAFEWLNLGYYLPVQGDIASCVETLRKYLNGEIVPSEYGPVVAQWANSTEKEHYTKQIWIALDKEWRDYYNLELCELLCEEFKTLLSGKQEMFQIFQQDEGYISGGEELSDQGAILICSKKDLPCSKEQYIYTIAFSEALEPDVRMSNMMASLVLRELPSHIEEISYYCLTENEIDDEFLVDGIMVHTKTDELGYRYMTYFSPGAINPPSGFITLPREAKAGKEVLDDEGRLIWRIILDMENLDRKLKISKVS